MKIRWIGQSGYVIKTDTTEIILDPYLSDAVNRVEGRVRLVEPPIQPEKIKADAVICTHNHLDHLDIDAIEEMDKSLLFVSTHEGVKKLQELRCNHVKAVSVGDTFLIGDIECSFVYAKHTVEAFGVVLKTKDLTLYFSGDTEYDEKLFDIAEKKPDITFICINGKLGNMNVEEAVKVAQRIGAKLNVPNHYGMFASNTENPGKFTDKLENGYVMEFNREYCIDRTNLIHI